MVAASKLRTDQRKLDNGMPFALPIQRLIGRITVPDPKTDLTVVALSSGLSSLLCFLFMYLTLIKKGDIYYDLE
ncbi:ATP synthase gama chain, putative [Eimeria maxima]|uniref:ATP synthase gama chain, putative n=1 Tax=Eimeria maxima TaxID=5804 RepID=U6M8W5_EIMMA|nr:ATP synthase gama chain, putative [Eimeria maxima]CDJ58934.1 ATP synthase gama chain, putative [Eimeria maxima]